MPILSALLLTLTALLVAGCFHVCWRCYRRARSSLPPEGLLRRVRNASPGVLPVSKPAPGSDAQQQESECLEARVVREVFEATSRAEAVLALNELTTEVAYALSDARTIPRAVGRVALLGATALGLFTIALGLKQGQGGQPALLGGLCVASGLVGAAGCGIVGGLARKCAEMRRDRARDLIHELSKRLDGRLPADGDAPTRAGR